MIAVYLCCSGAIRAGADGNDESLINRLDVSKVDMRVWYLNDGVFVHLLQQSIIGDAGGVEINDLTSQVTEMESYASRLHYKWISGPSSSWSWAMSGAWHKLITFESIHSSESRSFSKLDAIPRDYNQLDGVYYNICLVIWTYARWLTRISTIALTAAAEWMPMRVVLAFEAVVLGNLEWLRILPQTIFSHLFGLLFGPCIIKYPRAKTRWPSSSGKNIHRRRMGGGGVGIVREMQRQKNDKSRKKKHRNGRGWKGENNCIELRKHRSTMYLQRATIARHPEKKKPH